MDIAVTCPQCGAEVDLPEESTVFKCLYCGTILKPTGRNQIQSFFIAPRENARKVGEALIRALRSKDVTGAEIAEQHLVYAPYWRVSGMFFQWIFGRKHFTASYGTSAWETLKELKARPWFRTFPAFDSSEWGPPSIGLRAQTLKIWPFNKQRMGGDLLLVRQTVSFTEATKLVRSSIERIRSGKDIEIEMAKSELVGDRYSLLFFPFYCFTLERKAQKSVFIVDALSHKVIKGIADIDELKANPASDTIPYRPLKFLPFRCPNCGWDFPFKPHAKIHVCRVCGQAWKERGGEYAQVPYSLAERDDSAPGCKYLPFWRLTAVINTGDVQYKTLKEFFKLFPLPRVMDEAALQKRDIYFYVPAFRIKDVRAVDKFSARLTRTQPQFTETAALTHEQSELYDVCLSMRDAEEMAHVLLYSMTKKDHKTTKDIVRKAELDFTHTLLFYLPFVEKGIYLREPQTDFALQRNAIELE
jgi:ribosomal protein S27E